MIIGIHGKLESGKTTFAKMLNQIHFEKTWQHLAVTTFAEPMRVFLLRCLGLDSNPQGKTFALTEDSKIKSQRLVDSFEVKLTGGYHRIALRAAELIYEYTGRQAKGFEIQYLYEIFYKDNHTFREDLTLREALQKVGTDWGRHYFPTIWVDKAIKTIQDLAGTYDYVLVPDVRFDNEAEVISDLGGIVVEVVRPKLVTNIQHSSEKRLPTHMVDCAIINDGSLEDLREKAKQFYNEAMK